MQYRKLKDLKKLDGNPRYILEKDFDRLVKSVKDNPDYFEARPLILSDRTGELVIIAGNQRYEAAVKLGMKEVPTYLLSGLTEEREKELIIRDNVSNGSWDMDILANEFDEILLEEWGAPVFLEDEEELPQTDEQQEIIPKLIVECELPKELEKLYKELQARGFVCELK